MLIIVVDITKKIHGCIFQQMINVKQIILLTKSDIAYMSLSDTWRWSKKNKIRI